MHYNALFVKKIKISPLKGCSKKSNSLDFGKKFRGVLNCVQNASKDGSGAQRRNTDAFPYPHDIINFIPTSKDNIYEICMPLYDKGCNLKQIAKLTGYPRTSIRSALLKHNVELRIFNHATLKVNQTPKNGNLGASPYGYCYHNGRLNFDQREQRIVIAVYALWKKGMTLKAIKNHLHDKKIFTRFNKKWTQTLLEKIIKRHEEQIKKGFNL